MQIGPKIAQSSPESVHMQIPISSSTDVISQPRILLQQIQLLYTGVYIPVNPEHWQTWPNMKAWLLISLVLLDAGFVKPFLVGAQQHNVQSPAKPHPQQDSGKYTFSLSMAYATGVPCYVSGNQSSDQGPQPPKTGTAKDKQRFLPLLLPLLPMIPAAFSLIPIGIKFATTMMEFTPWAAKTAFSVASTVYHFIFPASASGSGGTGANGGIGGIIGGNGGTGGIGGIIGGLGGNGDGSTSNNGITDGQADGGWGTRHLRSSLKAYPPLYSQRRPARPRPASGSGQGKWTVSGRPIKGTRWPRPRPTTPRSQ